MMLVRRFPGREVTPEEKEQLEKEINKVIQYLNEGEIEKGLEKAQQIFSQADEWRGPPLFMWDFIASMLYGEHLPDQGSKEKYLKFLRAVTNKRILDHDWIRRHLKHDIPSPIANIAIWSISEMEYSVAIEILNYIPEQAFIGEQIIDILEEIKNHNELIQELKRRIPDFTNLEKCLKDQKKFNEVFRTVMDNFKETSKESTVNNGKEEVEKKLKKYRDEPKRYVNKLEQKYPKTYEILYSVEAIFSHPVFKMPIWKDVEATPRAVNYFKTIETFLKEGIPSPNKWTLGSYIRKDGGLAIKNKLNTTWKHRWGKPYNHEIPIKEGSKRYSLYNDLNQFLKWRNGKLHSSTTNWNFVNAQLIPLTYELLCNLMDGIE